MLKISFNTVRDVMVLEFEGDINVDAANFVEAVGWSLAKGYRKIVCNLESVNIIDYVGISLIAVAYKNVINHKAELRMCHVPAHVARLFTVVGLDRVFEYFLDEDRAMKGFHDEKRIARVLSKKFRRRFKRISINGTIGYRRKGAFDDTFYEGKIVNMSAIGVFASCGRIFPVGEILTTQINAEDFKIELDTRVVWIADPQIQKDDPHSVGLEFYHISSENQSAIVDFVERHLSRLR